MVWAGSAVTVQRSSAAVFQLSRPSAQHAVGQLHAPRGMAMSLIARWLHATRKGQNALLQEAKHSTGEQCIM